PTRPASSSASPSRSPPGVLKSVVSPSSSCCPGGCISTRSSQRLRLVKRASRGRRAACAALGHRQRHAGGFSRLGRQLACGGLFRVAVLGPQRLGLGRGCLGPVAHAPTECLLRR